MASILKVNTIQDATNSNTAMTIDSTGRILTPTRPAFKARHNGSSFATNSATIAWNTTDGTYGSFDIGGNYNTSTYKYIVPITGIYWFQMQSITNLNANDTTLQIRGGSDGTSSLQEAHITSTNSNWEVQTITAFASCTAGDQIHCYQAGNFNWYGANWGYFGGYLIG